MLNETALRSLIDTALGGVTAQGLPSEREWDSLDQLEITTHLNDELGDAVNEIEELNSFETIEVLTGILRDAGFLE